MTQVECEVIIKEKRSWNASKVEDKLENKDKFDWFQPKHGQKEVYSVNLTFETRPSQFQLNAHA